MWSPGLRLQTQLKKTCLTALGTVRKLAHTHSLLFPLPPMLEGVFWAVSLDWLEIINFNL